MKTKYLLIFLFCWATGYSQSGRKLFIKETQRDSVRKEIKTMLIVGVGSTVTRVFLDEFTDFIIKDFTNANIATTYHYLGKTMDEAKLEWDTINRESFDAVLLLVPDGTSFFDSQGGISRNTYTTARGPVTTMIATSNIDYEQDFNFLLYVKEDMFKKTWAASVEVYCDPGRSGNAKKLATKLMSCFKTNKYINK